MSEIGMKREVRGTFDEVLARLPEALKAEGFGVLTRIDVQATLKEKLGIDFRRYQILGACNPKLAHQAISAVESVGVLLPCNVVVFERDDGRVVVVAVDPMQARHHRAGAGRRGRPGAGEAGAGARRRRGRVRRPAPRRVNPSTPAGLPRPTP